MQGLFDLLAGLLDGTERFHNQQQLDAHIAKLQEEMRAAAVRVGDEPLASAIATALFRHRARSWMTPVRRVLRRVPGARRAWAHLLRRG